MHGSPVIYLTTEDYHEKTQLGDSVTKAVRPDIASNGVSYLIMTSIGSHSTSVARRDEKETGDRVLDQEKHFK